MGRRSSIRSTRRGRTDDERGYALISALVLAILYLGLMELMLIDTRRTLVEASRFRSHVIAETLAENAAELEAVDLVHKFGNSAGDSNDQGVMSGSMAKTGPKYVIIGQGQSTGVPQTTATVRIQGHLSGSQVSIDYTDHSQ